MTGPEEEISSSWMSPRPPRSVTPLKCKNLSGGFKYCAACPSCWRLASHLWWRSLSSTYAVPSPPHLSPPVEVGTLISGIRRFLLLARAMEAEFDDQVPHFRPFVADPQVLARICRWCDLVAFSPADCERSALQLLLGLRESGNPRLDDSWYTRPASTFYSSAQGLPISFGACWKLFPALPALSRSGKRHFTLFKQVLKRLGMQNLGSNPAGLRGGVATDFLATYPRHPRTSTTRTMVQRLQERAYFLRTTCVPVDTEARLDSLAELAPVLLASAPLPPPTPTPTFLQWD